MLKTREYNIFEKSLKVIIKFYKIIKLKKNCFIFPIKTQQTQFFIKI